MKSKQVATFVLLVAAVALAVPACAADASEADSARSNTTALPDTAAWADTVASADPRADSAGGGAGGDSTVITIPKAVSNIFSRECAGCHGGQRPSAGLDLSTGEALRAMVGTMSSEVDTVALVDPGNPKWSYLIMKVTGTGVMIGNRMPIGGRLTPEEVTLLVNWVSSMPRMSSAPGDTSAPRTAPQETAPSDTTMPGMMGQGMMGGMMGRGH